jgi:hypothetical protein
MYTTITFAITPMPKNVSSNAIVDPSELGLCPRNPPMANIAPERLPDAPAERGAGPDGDC